MIKRLSKLFKGNFVRNILIVASGTAGAQLIAMLAAPVITRLYGPESFGQLGIFTAVISILAPVAALTYPNAIVLPKSDNNAARLVKLSILIASVFSLLLFVLLFLLGGPILEFFKLTIIEKYILLVPFALLFFSLYQVIQQWLIRQQQFKLTAKTAFLQSLFINSAQMGIGLYNPVATVLIVISTASHFLYSLMLYVGYKKSNVTFNNEKLEPDLSIRELFLKYRDFPIYRSPQVLINTISQSFPVIIIATFFGPVSAGFYTLAKTIMGIPSNLLGKSVSDVFYPKINQAFNDKQDVLSHLKRATKVLAIAGLVPFSVVILFGPLLFGFVFGSEWEVAGEYARWLAFWFYSMLCTTLCATILPVVDGQKFHLNFTILKTVLRVASVYAGYYMFKDELNTIIFYSFISTLVNVYFIFKVFGLVQIKVKDNTNVGS